MIQGIEASSTSGKAITTPNSTSQSVLTEFRGMMISSFWLSNVAFEKMIGSEFEAKFLPHDQSS